MRAQGSKDTFAVATALDQPASSILSLRESAMLRTVFQACDVNKSGDISKSELIKRCRQDPQTAKFFGLPSQINDAARAVFEEVFQGIDGDSDRKIGFSELEQFYATKVQTEMTLIDTPDIQELLRRVILLEKSTSGIQPATDEWNRIETPVPQDIGTNARTDIETNAQTNARTKEE